MPRRPRTETIRAEVVSRLYEAVKITEEIAKKADEKPAGSAALPPGVRWYQVMGYLAQTLDGLLRNVDLNETKKDLAELQKMVVQLQAGAAKATP